MSANKKIPEGVKDTYSNLLEVIKPRYLRLFALLFKVDSGIPHSSETEVSREVSDIDLLLILKISNFWFLVRESERNFARNARSLEFKRKVPLTLPFCVGQASPP